MKNNYDNETFGMPIDSIQQGAMVDWLIGSPFRYPSVKFPHPVASYYEGGGGSETGYKYWFSEILYSPTEIIDGCIVPIHQYDILLPFLDTNPTPLDEFDRKFGMEL